MARIRHVAVFCKDPNASAEFYAKLFDLKEVARSQVGTIYLSDGEMNLAFIQHHPDMGEPVGINHIGFQVESMEAFRERMKAEGLDRPLEKPNIPGSYFEFKMKDPENITVDVSDEGWAH